MSPLYLFIFTQIISTAGFLVVVILASVCLVLSNRRRAARIFSLCALGLMASTELLKDTFHVARPQDALIMVSGYAFPSGHASGAAFLGLSFAYFARTLPTLFRYVAHAFLLILVLAIGFSRVQLRVHTPLQVLAGFALGTLWALVYIVLLSRAPSVERV